MVKKSTFVPTLCAGDFFLGQNLFFIGSPGFGFCLKSSMFSSMRMRLKFDDDLCSDVFLDPDRVLSYHTIIEVKGVDAPGTLGSPLFDELCRLRVVIFAGFDDIESHAEKEGECVLFQSYLMLLSTAQMSLHCDSGFSLSSSMELRKEKRL